MLLHPVCGRGWSCVLWPTVLRGRVACVLRKTHQLCPLRSSLCFSASRSHQGRWRLSLASGSGASVVAFIPAVVVFVAASVAFVNLAGTVGESATATASGAAAALDATTKSDSMPLPEDTPASLRERHAVCCGACGCLFRGEGDADQRAGRSGAGQFHPTPLWRSASSEFACA